MFDFGIVVAKDIEEDAVLRQLKNKRPVKYEQALKYTQGEWEGYSAVVVRTTRQGSVHSAMAAMDLSRDFNPRYLVLIGIAAGFRKNAKLGSIVIADQVWGYEYSKLVGDSIEREPETFRPPEVLQIAPDIDREVVAIQGFDLAQSTPIVVGPIASGSKVVASRAFLNKLLHISRKMAALEMEAEGVAATAFHRGKPFFVVKAISDYGDKASKGRRETAAKKRIHDERQRFAAEAAAQGFATFLRRAHRFGTILPIAKQSTIGPAVVSALPPPRAAEAEFLRVMKEGKPLTLGALNLQCRVFPKALWEVPARKERAYQDNREQRTRLEVAFLEGAVLSKDDLDSLTTLMTEIRARLLDHSAGRIKLSNRELEDLVFTERQLNKQGSNPYPRPIAAPEPFDIGEERILRITLGPSRYGVSLIRERNLPLPTAQALRMTHVLNSLAVRVAVVHDEEDQRIMEFHQRSENNGTYKFAWDIGAAGYIHRTDHVDPPGSKLISPWQTCVEEIDTELKIPGYLLNHRDQYRFFGMGMNEPTGQLDLLALCHLTGTKLPARVPDGDRVIAFESCSMNPEEIAAFVRAKKKWVPTALLTIVFVLEYFGFPRARIEQAFSPLADHLDLDR